MGSTHMKKVEKIKRLLPTFMASKTKYYALSLNNICRTQNAVTRTRNRIVTFKPNEKYGIRDTRYHIYTPWSFSTRMQGSHIKNNCTSNIWFCNNTKDLKSLTGHNYATRSKTGSLSRRVNRNKTIGQKS